VVVTVIISGVTCLGHVIKLWVSDPAGPWFVPSNLIGRRFPVQELAKAARTRAVGQLQSAAFLEDEQEGTEEAGNVTGPLEDEAAAMESQYAAELQEELRRGQAGGAPRAGEAEPQDDEAQALRQVCPAVWLQQSLAWQMHVAEKPLPQCLAQV
jgi:hypothetical protein